MRLATYGADNVLDKALDRIKMEEPGDSLRKAYGGVSRCAIRWSASHSFHHTQDGLEHISREQTYSFAKTPLKAAQAPLATANTIQWFLSAQVISSASTACAVFVLSRLCFSAGWDPGAGSSFRLMTPGSDAAA